MTGVVNRTDLGNVYVEFPGSNIEGVMMSYDQIATENDTNAQIAEQTPAQNAEIAEVAAEIPAPAPEKAEPAPKKKGFFARLFGR